MLGAQFPDGLSWVYHSHLNGLRERCSVDACCSSSGRPALEELSGSIYAAKENDIAINIFAESSVELSLTEGGIVSVQQLADYPFSGKIKVLLKTDSRNPFPLYLRIPGWAESYEIKINGKVQELNGKSNKANEYVKLETGRMEFQG